jgi:redox-sensitive bicupin YhaK (pirin superfamily)
MSVDGLTGMAVPPHPHIGLQTVTWLLAGNVLHRDSCRFGEVGGYAGGPLKAPPLQPGLRAR